MDIYDHNNKWIQKMYAILDNRRIHPLVQIKYNALKPKDYIYCELHHIIPKSWFRQRKLQIDNSQENIIALTAIEHLKVHGYLRNYFDEIGDIKQKYANADAINRMCKGNQEFIDAVLKDIPLDKFNAIYEENKKIALQLRRMMISKAKKGMVAITNPTTKKNKYIAKDVPLPNGFVYGYTSSERYKKVHKQVAITRKRCKGMVWISNIETHEQRMIPKDQCIPNGWIKFRIKPTNQKWTNEQILNMFNDYKITGFNDTFKTKWNFTGDKYWIRKVFNYRIHNLWQEWLQQEKTMKKK